MCSKVAFCSDRNDMWTCTRSSHWLTAAVILFSDVVSAIMLEKRKEKSNKEFIRFCKLNRKNFSSINYHDNTWQKYVSMCVCVFVCMSERNRLVYLASYCKYVLFKIFDSINIFWIWRKQMQKAEKQLPSKCREFLMQIKNKPLFLWEYKLYLFIWLMSL